MNTVWISFLTFIVEFIVILCPHSTDSRTRVQAYRYPRPVPTICPCAWLERGGFWADRRYSPFPGGVYVADRCPCREGTRPCSRQWEYGPRSLSFNWIGMPDSRDYQFQMHFCDIIYPRTLRLCRYGEPAYELRQMGAWLILQQFYCKCQMTTTDVSSFSYPHNVSPDEPFQGTFVNMTCKVQPTCPSTNSVCYYEPVYSVNKLQKGNVKCICPHGYFCPLNYIQGRREPLRYLQNYTDEYPYAYVVRCRPRWANMNTLRQKAPWFRRGGNR